MTAVDPRPSVGAGTAAASAPGPARSSRSLVATVRAYVALTKPRIIELLLVTTVPTMVLAAGGLPGLSLVLATLLGGGLAAAGANALNCYLDRDIDAVMHRTGNRPLVTGLVSPPEALAFGLLLTAAAGAVLGWLVNPLSAGLALAAVLLYVVGYTMILKRRTAQNIVWGGAAGCMPVLIGWAAVRGRLDWAAGVLFLIIFFWTPPHYWPLSLRFRADYAAARVPMLGAVAGERVVTRRVVGYSWAMVAASLLLWPVAPTGPVYGVAAVVLGVAFLVEAHRLAAAARRGVTGPALRPMRLFHGSISYLTLLFLAVALDPVLR